MGRKRQPISFPELEGRGRKAILRSSEEVRADEQLLASQQASSPALQQAGIPASQLPPARSSYLKATYRLSQEAIEQIDDAKRLLRRQYGIKASLEEIADCAIKAAYRDLQENQHASFLVLQLAGKQETEPGGDS